MRLIDADELKFDYGFTWDDITPTHEEMYTLIDRQPTVDAEPVVRCRDCKHKPSGDGANHNVEFPDGICPCQCEDYWYSWIPKDNFFCAWGERKEE